MNTYHVNGNTIKRFGDMFPEHTLEEERGKKEKNIGGVLIAANTNPSIHSAKAEIKKYIRDTGDDNSYNKGFTTSTLEDTCVDNITALSDSGNKLDEVINDSGNDNREISDEEFVKARLQRYADSAKRVRERLGLDKSSKPFDRTNNQVDNGNENIKVAQVSYKEKFDTEDLSVIADKGSDNITDLVIARCSESNLPEIDMRSDNITLLRGNEFAELNRRLNIGAVKVTSHQEVYEILVKHDLRQFLGAGKDRFKCCAIHAGNDNAKVIVNPESGVQRYICDGEHCPLHGRTITDVTMKLTGLERQKATRALMQIYNIQYQLWDFQERMIQDLDRNIQFLGQAEILPEQFPYLNRLMGRYTTKLIRIHEITKSNLPHESYWRNGRFYGFTSMRYLAKEFGHSRPDYINDIFNLIVVLGLIQKYNNHEIPIELFRIAQGVNAVRNRVNSYIPTFYHIPPYDNDRLANAEEQAKKLLKYGFTMRGFSRAMFIDFLDKEEVDSFFPQQANRPINTLDAEAQDLLLVIALQMIADKGYMREEYVIKEYKDRHGGQKQLISHHLKAIIPMLMSDYGLTKIKVNKHFKEQYGIQETGYPYFYVWNE